MNPTTIMRRFSEPSRRERLQLMYVFERKVRLKPRFGFQETVRKVAMEHFPHRFAEALQIANNYRL